MQFHILDENYVPVAIMDNDLPDAIHFQKSKLHRFSTGSADFFDFEIPKLHVDSDKFQVGYWIAFRYDERDRLLYINDIQEAEQDNMMSISTLNNNLDLNNETKQPFSATEEKPFKWYFDTIMFDTGYEIGINEISNLTRKLSWDSEMTIRAFIQSVATQFDNAELDYEVILNSDFTIKKRLVHIKKRIGEIREDIELRYGENIKTVKRSTNIDNLYTAIRPISKDDNDKITTIASYPDWQQLDENGNVKFFHKQGDTIIKAPIANARFGNRGISVTGGGYVVYDYSYDKVSQSDLFNRSVAKLEEISVPAINYEVEGRTGAKIGDTVKIVDDGYSPELILSARVLEQVVSFDDATVEQATFGNYKALESQISDDLIAKMQQLAEENAPYKATTLTTKGLTFKNSQGSTVLTARLFKGTKEIVPDSYIWTKDNVTLLVSESTLTVDASNVDSKTVMRWSAVINDVAVAFDEITITDISDGENGISPTVTVNPDTSLTIVDAQGTSTTPVLKGSDGTDGTDGTSGIIVSSVAPDSPQTGQLWQDTSTTPQLVKKWTGSDWVIWELYAQNLKADSLSALSANLGDMNGGTVKLMDNISVNGTLKKFGIYQSKLGLLSSGAALATTSTFSNSQMGVVSLNKGELRFMVTDYTENLKGVQDAGMSDQNHAFIKFDSYDNGKDVMLIGSSGDIVFKGITSQDTPWVTLSSGVKYKFMFSRMYISVDVVGDGNSFMQFGTLPQNLRPISDQFMVIANQGAGTADDRHMMVRASDGAVVLWTPKSGITYRGEVSYTL